MNIFAYDIPNNSLNEIYNSTFTLLQHVPEQQ